MTVSKPTNVTPGANPKRRLSRLTSRSLLPLLMVLASPLGCESTLSTPTPVTADVTSARPAASTPTAPSTQTTAAASKPENTIALQPGGSAAVAAAAVNDFAFRSYGLFAAKPGNHVFSPASISVALAMTASGAKGDTAQELYAALGAKDAAALDPSWQTVLAAWQDIKGMEIAVANRLFGHNDFKFEGAFLASSKQQYGAPMKLVDFAANPQGERKAINAWVADRTNKKIEDLIPPPGVTDQTRLVLANAIYLKGSWSSPFSKMATKDAPFNATKAKVTTPFMNATKYFKYRETKNAQVVDLPLKGGAFSMTVVLPQKGTNLSTLESALSAKAYDEWTKDLESERIALSLPKFKIKPAKEAISLRDLLTKMKVMTAFDANKADFTGIANPKSPADRLYISNVFHKAFVGVDEAGVEAAAATAVSMARAGSAAPTEPPKEVKVDRPFLFLLRDTARNIVVFVGRVDDPTQG